MSGTVVLAIAGFFVLLAVGFVLASLRVKKRGEAVRVPMQEVAARAGWQDVRPRRIGGVGIEGTWNGYSVRIGFSERMKGIPPQLYVKAKTQSEAVLTIKRPPARLFSGEKLEMAAAPDLAVRGNSRMLADRIFASSDIVRRIRENLLGMGDDLRIERRYTRINRFLRDDTVKGRMRGNNTAAFDHIVYDEWDLMAKLLSEVILRA